MRALLAMSLLLAGLANIAIAANPAAISPRGSSSATLVQTAPSPEITKDVADHQLQDRVLSQEAKFLKTQLASVESYHESVLSTSYFALGTVFTITLLLLGYSWWFNTRAYESDKANFRQELASRLAAAEDRIALKEQSARTAAESAISARLDSLASMVSANHIQLRSEIADSRANAEKSSSEVRQRVDWLFKEFRTIEEMVWALNGVPQNSLLSLAQGMELCSDDPSEDMFDILSRRFNARADEMINAKTVLDHDMRTSIERAVKSNETIRAEKTEQILKRLSKIRSPDI